MTSTIFIVTLLGTLTGYPLMKKWNALQLEAKDETKEQYPTVFSHLSPWWVAVILAVPVMIYQPDFVLVIMALALISGLFPPIILPLLAGMIFGAYFLNPIVCVAAFFIISIPAIIANRRTYRFRNYSFKHAALACALSILLVESILLVSAQTNFMSKNPEMLNWIGGNRAIPSLLTSLKQPDLNVKSAAIKELKKYPEDTWTALVRDFKNGDTLQQRFTVEMGVENGKYAEISNLGETSIAAFDSAVSSDEPAVSKVAVKELMKLKAIPQLLTILPKVELNRIGNSTPLMAFEELQKLKTEEILPQIMHTFRGVPEKGLDYGVSKEIAKFGEPAIPILINYLDSDDKYEAKWAEYSLFEFGVFAKPQLMEALKHGKANRQHAAASILAELKIREAIPMLIKMLNDEKMRNHAAWCLGVLEDSSATPALIALYRKAPDREILADIGMTGGNEAKLFLEELMLKTRDPQVRQDAFNITAQVFWGENGKSGIRMYVSLLAAPEKEIRQNAAKRLREFNEPSLLPFLLEADKREHKTGTPIEKCEIHATIAAFSK